MQPNHDGGHTDSLTPCGFVKQAVREGAHAPRPESRHRERESEKGAEEEGRLVLPSWWSAVRRGQSFPRREANAERQNRSKALNRGGLGSSLMLDLRG